MKFLIHNWVFLFLVNWSIILVHSDQKIQLNKWIETSVGNWPPTDGSTSQEAFLVFHSEYAAEPLFGLKKSFLADLKGNVDSVELSFKYWASGEGALRCRSPNFGRVKRDIRLLKGGDDWHSTPDLSSPSISGGTVLTHLKNISTEEWANFAFISHDMFTLGLKDVRVKYVDHSGLMIEVKCNLATGCDNIFDRKLPLSTLGPQEARYVPFQIEVKNISEIAEFEFARNRTLKGDFCVDFVYAAKEVPLGVYLRTNYPEILFPNFPEIPLPRHRTVCASWLTPEVAIFDDENALWFSFGSSIIYDIDNHYVKDLKLRPTPQQHKVCHCEVGWTGELCDNKV